MATPVQAFTVKTKEFEGPFEALLTMIEKKKLHISEVSLAEIADDYLSYVRHHELKLAHATDFVWTAATLMLIKSRHLLPQFLVTDEEEEDMSSLTLRLQIYAIYKQQIAVLAQQFGRRRMYQALSNKQTVVAFRPDAQITPQDMRQQMEKIFQTVEGEVFRPEQKVIRTRTLAEITHDIAQRVNQFVQVNFHELVAGLNRTEQAISFLAVLELFRVGEVDLEQRGQFEKITVTARTRPRQG